MSDSETPRKKLLDTTPTDTLFGTNLQKARRQQNLTQEKLAETAGVSTTIVSDYENRRKSPSLGYAKALAEALHIPLDTLCEDNAFAQYIKDLEREPVVALLTVIKLFKFHIRLLDDGSINLSMPADRAGYSASEIRKFFKEYEIIQEFAASANSDSGKEMKEKLITHIQEKYNYLPDLPIYEFPK